MNVPTDRVIYHIDCNAFYATCECMEHPEWNEVPMVVAGNPKDRCGIILAKNERAKAYGVKTAETIFQHLHKKYGRGCIAMGYMHHPELGIHQSGFQKENLL